MGVLLLLSALVQSPADRVAIESLRDSLGAVSDTVALHRLEATTIEVAKQRRNDPLIHLRLGFIGYRLGETTKAKQHFDDAAGEFEWAAELQNDWPYPWYGLGLAELALGESSSIALENLRQMLGKDYLSKAARAFARAAEADPSFASAVVDLATTALTQRIHPRLEVALNAVRLAAAGPAGRHADVQLVRGRVEREAGEADSAIAAFTTYLAVGGDSGVGLLELARSYYFAHRPGQGWVAYFAGARAATSAAALTLYRLDLSWIADSSDLVAFDGLPNPDARQQWLERFWARRDAAQARDVGERLAEHYRRWFYARQNFRLVSRHRHYDMTEVYRTTQTEFDDRGVIYLRHGEPDKRAQFICQSSAEPNGEGCAANESWLYHRRDGDDLIFHFAARDDVQDFKLVESLADVLGFNRAVRATSSVDPELTALYQTRDDFGPLYARVATVPHAPGPELAQDRRQGRRNIELGTTTDSYTREFQQPLDVAASDFVVGADSAGRGGQTLHVVFAIPGDRLPEQPVPGGAGVRYPLEFRLVVSDSSGDVVASLDTVRVFGARQALHGPAYLSGSLALAVPPGHYDYRLLVRSLGGGAAAGVGDLLINPVAVDALEAGRFAVSDVVVGRDGSGLVWMSPAGDTVRLNPLQRVPQGGTVSLYYEVYGLPAGATYHTVVRLEKEGGRSLLHRLFGGGHAPVLLEFDAPSAGVVTRVQRGIALRDVSKGTYRLTVVIADPARGASVTRTQRFQVVDRPTHEP